MHDAETGLIYNDARYRHPRLGRFLTPDPLNQNIPGGGYHDGMNRYQMLRGNPVNYLDPDGTDVITLSSREIDWVPAVAGHLSVEYWETDCPGGPDEPMIAETLTTTELNNRGYSRVDHWELIGEFNWCLRRRRGGRHIVPSPVSVINRTGTGTDHTTIFNTQRGDVSNRWDTVSTFAQVYP